MEKEVLPGLRNPQIIDTELIIDYEDEEKISVRVVYNIVEEVGYFRERT